MKKRLLFILLTAASVSAQQKKMDFGINAGITYATFRGNYFVDDTQGSPNFLVGITGEYKIDILFSVIANINYSRKSIKSYDATYPGWENGTINFDDSPVTVKNSTIFQYITIPVMLKMMLWGDNKLYMNGGGYYSHLVDVSNYTDGEKSDLDFNSGFVKSDMGLVLGVGYRITIDNANSLNIELRDEYGLKNIGDEEAAVFSPTKSNSANLLVIWYFN
jgi:hypothetical protein